MGRKNSPSANKELNELIAQYETAKAENRQLYLDGDQLADIADRYAAERKFDEAQEVITYGLHLHPDSTDLLVEQAYLYLDTGKIPLAKKVAESITDDYITDVKMLKAELLLNEGQLEAARSTLDTIEDTDELETIINIIYLYMDMGYPEAAKEWLDKGTPRFGKKEDFIAVMADYLAGTNELEAASTYYGHCYFYLNNSDAAIENYTKAIEYKAFPPEMGYMFLGMAYSNKGAWQEADDCYQRVIDRFVADGAGNSPLLIDTYTNKAVAASQLGKHEEAHLLCKKAKKIQPDDPGIHLTEGKLYMKEGQKKKAVKAFDKALVMEPSAEMWYLVASAYSDAEYLYQAKLCFEESYRIDPNYADVTEKLSILSLMHNEIDDFFKYNSESAHPISEDIILDLLSRPNQTEEGEQMLKEVWKRMKKEKGNK